MHEIGFRVIADTALLQGDGDFAEHVFQTVFIQKQFRFGCCISLEFYLAYEFGSPESFFDAGVLRGYYETAEITQATLDERALSSRPTSIRRITWACWQRRSIPRVVSSWATSHKPSATWA